MCGGILYVISGISTSRIFWSVVFGVLKCLLVVQSAQDEEITRIIKCEMIIAIVGSLIHVFSLLSIYPAAVKQWMF